MIYIRLGGIFMEESKMKFCKYCAKKIAEDAVMCIHCGRQVEELKVAQQQVVINNTNTNSNVNTNINSSMYRKEKNKWVALALCILLGFVGAHKFYEGKIGLGVVYLFTCGLFGFGIIVDFFALLFKPNPYYV